MYLIVKFIWLNLIELIFPCFCVNCGKINTLLCSNCYEKIEFFSFNFDVSSKMKFVDEVIIVCKYQGVVKKLIHDFKYKGVIGIGTIIAQIIYRSINLPKYDILITVPIHKNKQSKRGFNQSEEIIKSLSKIANISYLNLLIKTKITMSQMSITNKDERKSNVENSFAINQGLKNHNEKSWLGKNILIIDDVLTTGSTMDECAKILKENGVKKVIGLAFAHR